MAEENGQVEETEMMEDAKIEEAIKQAKDENDKEGMPKLDAEKGREESEDDLEGGTSKAADPKTKASNASAKAEGKKEVELKELETLEEKYLNRFYHFLMYAKDELFKGFETSTVPLSCSAASQRDFSRESSLSSFFDFSFLSFNFLVIVFLHSLLISP